MMFEGGVEEQFPNEPVPGPAPSSAPEAPAA